MNSNDLTAETELLEQLNGNLNNVRESAFEKIYQCYWKPVFTLAYHRLHSKQAAEDIVQDVFAGLWSRQNNPGNAPIVSLSRWLAAATKYAVVRQLARSARSRTDLLNEDMLIETSHDPVNLLFIEQMLIQEVNRLPQKCKLVFQYSRNNCLPNKEIAKQLNLSEKTVEKHITTAIRKLRNQLKEFFLL